MLLLKSELGYSLIDGHQGEIKILRDLGGHYLLLTPLLS